MNVFFQSGWAAVLLLAVAQVAIAQPDMAGKEVKGFVFPQYDENGELLWRLKGDAKFETAERVQLANVRMESFANGKPRVVFVTPFCYFDTVKKAATTNRAVEIMADEFSVSGEGLEWSSDEGKFVLRRNVKFMFVGPRGRLFPPEMKHGATPPEGTKQP
jgi:hypothetical protein